MKRIIISIMLLGLLAFTARSQTIQSYEFTGLMQTFTVPCGVDTILLQAWGARGGTGATGGQNAAGGVGGLGGYAKGYLVVSPGQVLNIFVGSQGSAPTGGYNGGGLGGNNLAGGGGGASDIRIGGNSAANRILVAGGGGGGGRPGCESTSLIAGGDGGNGGGGNGGNGTNAPSIDGDAGGGQGAVGAIGGFAGLGCSVYLGQAGITATSDTGGKGGNGQTCCCLSFSSIPGGGGGGGGKIGGGGGGAGSAGTVGCSGNEKGAGGGGAGGTSDTSGVFNAEITDGVWFGNGMVTITYTPKLPVTPIMDNDTLVLCENNVLNYSVPLDSYATEYLWTASGSLTIVSGNHTNSVNVNVGSTGGLLMAATANACDTSAADTLVVDVKPLPVITAHASQNEICTGDSIFLWGSGASSFAWTGGVTDSVAFMPTTTLTYTVFGTGTNGCIGSDSMAVVVDSCLGIGNDFSINERVRVYPNPSSSKVTISSDKPLGAMTLYNTLGEVILQHESDKNEWVIDLSDEMTGIYFLRLTSPDNKRSYLKIIKE